LKLPHYPIARERARAAAANFRRALRYHAGVPARGWLERDDFSSNRHPALAYYWSMIFSENRYPLFGIML
jgi:hypothetical protein